MNTEYSVTIPAPKAAQYWPVSVIFLCVWFGASLVIALEQPTPDAARQVDWGSFKAAFGALFIAPVGAAVMLFIPWNRYALKADSAGFTLVPAHARGQKTRSYRWSDIATITYQGTGGRPGNFRIETGSETSILRRDALGLPPNEVMAILKAQARAGGYDLKGYRVDLPFMGGESWTLTPAQGT